MMATDYISLNECVVNIELGRSAHKDMIGYDARVRCPPPPTWGDRFENPYVPGCLPAPLSAPHIEGQADWGYILDTNSLARLADRHPRRFARGITIAIVEKLLQLDSESWGHRNVTVARLRFRREESAKIHTDLDVNLPTNANDILLKVNVHRILQGRELLWRQHP